LQTPFDLQKFLLVAKDLNVYVQYFYLIKVGFSCTHDTKYRNPHGNSKAFTNISSGRDFYDSITNILTLQQ